MSYLNYGNRELMKKARSLRNNMTKAEIILWSRLRSKQIGGFKFRRQQPILNYIVDFYCDSLKLIIEVDGEIHSSSEIIEYDISRENNLNDHGFSILRFVNHEVETELDSVMRKIQFFIINKFPELNR